jgi:hypothetical protein
MLIEEFDILLTKKPVLCRTDKRRYMHEVKICTDILVNNIELIFTEAVFDERVQGIATYEELYTYYNKKFKEGAVIINNRKDLKFLYANEDYFRESYAPVEDSW